MNEHRIDLKRRPYRENDSLWLNLPNLEVANPTVGVVQYYVKDHIDRDVSGSASLGMVETGTVRWDLLPGVDPAGSPSVTEKLLTWSNVNGLVTYRFVR